MNLMDVSDFMKLIDYNTIQKSYPVIFIVYW